MNETVTVIAVVLAGLFAGLFVTFSYAVMPGLRRTDDRRSPRDAEINVAILNPSGARLRRQRAGVDRRGHPGFDDEAARWWLVAGAVLVAAGR